MKAQIIKMSDRKPETDPQTAAIPRELLLQWREGLLLQLRAVEKMLWPDREKVEAKAQKV